MPSPAHNVSKVESERNFTFDFGGLLVSRKVLPVKLNREVVRRLNRRDPNLNFRSIVPGTEPSPCVNRNRLGHAQQAAVAKDAILLGYPRYAEHTERLHRHHWKVKNSTLLAHH